LNDQTLAGFKHTALKIAAVQFHPEASPGPHDSTHLVIERFLDVAGV
jgi:carbamoyl-phosphate synthase small subunit